MAQVRGLKVMEIIRSASGGMKEHYITLVKGLKEKGFNVVALCNFEGLVMEELQDAGIEVYRFSLPGEVQPLLDTMRVWKIVRIAHKHDVDVVHCHGFKAGVLGRMGALLINRPKVYTMHNFILPMGTPIKKWTVQKLEQNLSRRTEEIIAVSHALKQDIIKNCQLPPNRIKVIHNGISFPSHFSGPEVRRHLSLDKDVILVGTVARLIPSKGVDIFLEAIPMVVNVLKNIRFVVIGSGPYEEVLKKKAEALQLKNRVTFLGYVEPIWDYLDALDIFVLPTLSEGLGLSILEAMAVGKPVIATRVGGIPEIISHGDNGDLVSPGSAKELADAILYLAATPRIRTDYGQRGYRHVRQHFTVHKMVERTADVLTRCIK